MSSSNPGPRSYSRSRSRSTSPYSKRSSHSHHTPRPRRSDSPHNRRSHRSPSPDNRRNNRSLSPYSRRRNLSPSPRSRSPRRDRPKKPTSSGFRWKEKPRYEDDDRNDRRLERGYRGPERKRNRSPERPRGKERERDDVEAKFGKQNGVVRKEERDADVQDKFGDGKNRDKKSEREKKEKKPKIASAPVGQEMIIVRVNDRLGTAADIPCLASDPIKLFKAQVAARIGRKPHEIMLKRQGERPFKDQLTLEDYGVSNGVQLDLEIDTGD